MIIKHVRPNSIKSFATDPMEELPRWFPSSDLRDDNIFKPATIPALFAERASLHGQHHALAFKTSKADTKFTYVTWAEYFNTVMEVSKALVAIGVHPGDTVNILGFNHQNWYYACFGSIFAGAVAAGVYLTNSAEAVTHQVRHSKSKILFVDSLAQLAKAQVAKEACPHLEYIVMWPDNLGGEAVPAGVSGVLSWDDFVRFGQSVQPQIVTERIAALTPATPCFLSYTSGTTGPPKAAMHSHDSIVYACKAMWKGLLEAGDKTNVRDGNSICYLPLSHVGGSVFMFSNATCAELGTKSCTHFAFPDALQGSITKTLREVKPSYFFAVPNVWEKLHKPLQTMVEVATDGAKPSAAKLARAIGQ